MARNLPYATDAPETGEGLMAERRSTRARVLVVDDEPAERETLARLIAQWGFDVETAASGDEALALTERYRPAVVITDLILPGTDGLSVLQTLRAGNQAPVVLLVTGHATVETAVEAMRRGALDYLTKPIDTMRLQLLLQKAVEQDSLSREVTLLRRELRQRGTFGRFVGQSKRMQEVYHTIEMMANSNAPIFIHGESGTGKELVARTVHELSDRRAGPFVAINCAAIPETLIESELFGHERGAFTGASERRIGCFELADGGTLLLDELAEMNVATQAKLLRVLEEAAFRRVGGKAEVTVDVRVVAATNRVASEALANGTLREDLFYRLSVFVLELPPHRQRVEDIPLLAARFIEEFNAQNGRSVPGLTPDAEEALAQYAWPGNVRELRNAMHRAVVLAGSGAIMREHLPPAVAGDRPAPARAPDARAIVPLRDMERQMIIRALEETSYHKPRAAAMLGISLKTLYNKLARFGLPPNRTSSP
jgi:DNA-binding NtrC family response regulator